ncbi:unnamed protein product [Toxocara canis]|uniref:Small integral membrane protein n=1 Tax=Toxocara canis TaxID=6265 RepID=A0A183UB09_TOXCA|nr:unnamed protein product [Toxocara canis]
MSRLKRGQIESNNILRTKKLGRLIFGMTRLGPKVFKETFYAFAFIVVVCSILTAVFLSKVVGIRIREYPLNVDREWRDARPANPFHFPWNRPHRD